MIRNRRINIHFKWKIISKKNRQEYLKNQRFIIKVHANSQRHVNIWEKS